jgi:hypothetical protein
MKQLILKLTMICFLAFAAGNMSLTFAQYDYETETAPDTVSIDDMDPVLYTEEDETAEEKNNTALYIGIAVVAIAAGVLAYRSTTKKKK